MSNVIDLNFGDKMSCSACDQDKSPARTMALTLPEIEGKRHILICTDCALKFLKDMFADMNALVGQLEDEK